MLPVPKELGDCVGWRRCPDVCLGVLCCCPLACPLQRRSPAQPPRRTAVAGFQSRERVPGVPLFEPFSGLLSTSVCVSFLFSELIELGTGLSGALPLPARGCASQEAKAAKSGPPGPREPPNPFGDPRASSYPQPSLRQGHSWAGSGQSARLGTSVLARVALKARGGPGVVVVVLRTNPSIPSRCLLSRPQAEAAGDTGLAEFFLSPWEKRANRVGQVGISLLPSSLLLLNQMPHPASLLEGNRVLLPCGRCPGVPGGAGAQDTVGRPAMERIPLAANERSAGLGGRGRGAAQGVGSKQLS